MKRIIATIHQPTFIPWLGLLEKIYRSDVFIVFDTSTVRKNSVINRNKIKTPQGPIWLTVPIHTTLKTPVIEMKIDNSSNWKEKHLKSLFYNYKKAKNFNFLYSKIEKIYRQEWENLADFNMKLILLILKTMNLRRKIYFTSELRARGEKNEIIIDMLKKVDAAGYIAGQGSKDYLDKELFSKNNIKIIWQNFQHPVYEQLWGEFIPNLSVVDFLFCDGRKDILVK